MVEKISSINDGGNSGIDTIVDSNPQEGLDYVQWALMRFYNNDDRPYDEWKKARNVRNPQSQHSWL